MHSPQGSRLHVRAGPGLLGTPIGAAALEVQATAPSATRY